MGILIIFPVYPHNPQTQISQAPRGAIPDASSTSRQGLEGQGILWWWRYVTISWLSPANDVSKLNIGWLHQQKWWFHMVSYCFLPKKKLTPAKKMAYLVAWKMQQVVKRQVALPGVCRLTRRPKLLGDLVQKYQPPTILLNIHIHIYIHIIIYSHYMVVDIWWICRLQ